MAEKEGNENPRGPESARSAPKTAEAFAQQRAMSGSTGNRAVSERESRGEDALGACPMRSQGLWEAKPNRKDAIDLLEEQSRARLPELVPLRYRRMSASPFAFFRGSAIIMARDLAQTPCTGIEVQCIGDAHVANFGIFSSPTRRLVFDVNDFDETSPGPWEWDVKRLAASLEICGRNRGFDEKVRRDAVKAAARQYRKSMTRFAKMSAMDVWHFHFDVEQMLDDSEEEMGGKTARTLRKALEKAREKDSVAAAGKLAHSEGGRLSFNMQPPELVPVHELANKQGYGSTEDIARAMARLLKSYFESLPLDRRKLLGSYRLQDVARKVVGVGSVGTRSWAVLLAGKSEKDPLVMQVKEATTSVVERFWRPGSFENAGERVVQGQRLVQSTSDILLGWTSIDVPGGSTRDYYVRQLWNRKGSIDLDEIDRASLVGIGKLCARALAHAHARTGDEIAIATYLNDEGGFEDALWSFSRAYADQNEADYKTFIERMGSVA